MSAISYRENYGRVIRYAFAGTLSVHLLILLLSPPFEFRVYTMPPEPPPPLVDVEYAVTIPSEPLPEPEQPKVTLEGFMDPEPSIEDDLPAPPEIEPPRQRRYPMPEPPGVAIDHPLWVTRLPKATQLAKVRYPELARQGGMEGRVVIAILVGADGKPLRAKVLSSEVTRAMEAAALDAALKSRFEPAYQRTRPVASWVAIPFDFKLR